ncbi:hypothetical protein F4860DRAFT_498068 [Xylaria cubensis]|nr:hypothetical protein F4860DRAFT_498068 [Xylaria cubensis]
MQGISLTLRMDEEMEEEITEEIFSFVAPRARMALPQRGTLREMLLGGRASELVPLLTVPVRPRRPLPALGHQSDDALTFSNLPTEIHCLVFDHIEYIEDTICLGFTNKYFLILAQRYLDDYYMSFFGTWSGENIVCVGDDVEPDDYPARLFSTEELDNLRPLRTNVLRGDIVRCNTPFALSHFADPSVSDIEDFVDPIAEARRLLKYCKSLGKGKDPEFAARGWRIIPGESTYCPEDQPWILRNLTTKEFVRPEPIAIKPEYIHGPKIWLVGFGEVVMLRTCWSSAPSNVRINNTIGPPRGVWAGHRFDITTLAEHEGGIDSAEWTDVSDEVAREISEVWLREFGYDIRKDLRLWYLRRPNRGFLDIMPP